MDEPDPDGSRPEEEQPRKPTPAMDEPDAPTPADERSDHPASEPKPEPASEAPEWTRRYERARQTLIRGDFAAAAVELFDLEKAATTSAGRAAAHALRSVADEWTARGLAFTQEPDLAPVPATPEPDRRSVDELVALYTTSAVYGIGSGVWLATITKPDSAAAVILPTIALTAGAVGTVLAVDTGPGFRYGVPQSIVSGAWIGFEHGLVWAIFNDMHRRPSRGGDATMVASTIMWSLSTVGAIGGGVLGSVLPTTPGRSAWVGSTALWTGTLGGLLTGAFGGDSSPPTTALAVAGVGLTAGTGLGMLTAGSVSPSISRVRLLDLSAVLGGLTTSGLYIAAAGDNAQGAGVAGAMALGIAAGLGAGWLATSKMAADPLRRPDPKKSEDEWARDRARGGFLARIRPMLVPSQGGGAMMGAGGTLD